jgi:hypothetical protein
MLGSSVVDVVLKAIRIKKYLYPPPRVTLVEVIEERVDVMRPGIEYHEMITRCTSILLAYWEGCTS